MKKICSALLSVGLCVTAFTNVSHASEIDESVEYGKKNSPADYKEHFLPQEVSENQMGINAGTIVGVETNAYLWEGSVTSYGTSTCSKACAELRASNYLYKGSSVIDWAASAKYNNVSAIAVSHGGRYQSGNTYHSASDHYVKDYYGQTVIDRTVDDDL
ncbi:hypothetical protein [Priestia filamentosa]|uniref:hypothetical protein n=1 Tax=Priestia filamentosa TaxID=1402861 RepID=UPI00289514F2|nr:hypothetical protein [Priestia filamentosa]MDT3766396.1 hypothetical protein [Priestia filamentosa]